MARPKRPPLQQSTQEREESIGRADLLRERGQMQQALNALDAVRDRARPDARIESRRGLLLYLMGSIAEALEALTEAVRLEPSDGQSFKFLAGCLSALGRNHEALGAANSAVLLLPRDAQLRNALGAMSVNSGQFEAAIGHFHVALELNPSDPTPLANLEVLAARFGAAGLQKETPEHTRALRARTLAELSARLERDDLGIAEADLLCTLTNNHRETFGIAEKIEARFGASAALPAGFLINLAVVCQNRGDLQRALHYLTGANRLAIDMPEARNGLGALLVTEGGARWFDGWRLVSSTYRTLNPRNYPAEVVQWTGQALGEAKLLVHLDQGFGDALLGLRFLSHLRERGVRAVVWLPPELGVIVQSLDHGLELHVSELRPSARDLGCDFACGLLELVAPLGLSQEQIAAAPTLHAPPDAAAKWSTRMAGLQGTRIALVGQGNPQRIDDWLRSVEPAQLEPLAALDGISWVNLVVDRRPERESMMARFQMFDPSGEIESFADTAGILHAVDAVVAIDCATAHLAASMGKPLYVFKPTMLDWRWQIGAHLSPWWPKAQMLLADAPGDWGSAVIHLRDVLASLSARPDRDRG